MSFFACMSGTAEEKMTASQHPILFKKLNNLSYKRLLSDYLTDWDFIKLLWNSWIMKHYAAWVLFLLILDNDEGLQIIHCFTWRYLWVNFFISKNETKQNKYLAVFVQRTTWCATLKVMGTIIINEYINKNLPV